MKLLIGKLQRALQRYGVKASVAQLAAALHALEDDGITLAPHHLSPETRELALAASRRAKEAGTDPVEAFYDAIVARALVELHGMDAMRADADKTHQVITAGLMGA
jgi:hypothetical protein